MEWSYHRPGPVHLRLYSDAESGRKCYWSGLTTRQWPEQYICVCTPPPGRDTRGHRPPTGGHAPRGAPRARGHNCVHTPMQGRDASVDAGGHCPPPGCALLGPYVGGPNRSVETSLYYHSDTSLSALLIPIIIGPSLPVDKIGRRGYKLARGILQGHSMTSEASGPTVKERSNARRAMADPIKNPRRL